MSVEKKLHFVWVGDESKRPDACIDSWRRLNPDFEVRVWGNADLWGRRWVNQKHIEAMWQQELCGVADLMRYEILYEHGGIAMDADSLAVRGLEPWVYEPDEFSCYSSDRFLGHLVNNGVMGAKRHSQFIAAIIMDIHDRETVVDDRAWVTTGPTVVTRIWQKYAWPLTVWPSHMFIPDFHSGPTYDGSGPIFARQFHASTRNGMPGNEGKDMWDQIKNIRPDEVQVASGRSVVELLEQVTDH